jgi:hypothetical protein
VATAQNEAGTISDWRFTPNEALITMLKECPKTALTVLRVTACWVRVHEPHHRSQISALTYPSVAQNTVIGPPAKPLPAGQPRYHVLPPSAQGTSAHPSVTQRKAPGEAVWRSAGLGYGDRAVGP